MTYSELEAVELRRNKVSGGPTFAGGATGTEPLLQGTCGKPLLGGCRPLTAAVAAIS